MHEENKRSQMLISDTKRAYEDLQKRIDALNGKIHAASNRIGQLADLFTNEDLERQNEISRRLYAKLKMCDEDVNADTFEKCDQSVSP